MEQNQAPLRFYHENWWKVEGQDIWYLAGKHFDPLDDSFTPGKWYFTNEADMFSQPFDTRKDAEDALNHHTSNL